MSSKVNAGCKTVVARTNKNILENKQHLPTSETSQEGLILYDNCNTLIEVCVKTKGRKRTSTMVSSSSPSHKGIEAKKRPSSSGDSHQSWGGILREQNRAALKQGLQQLTKRASGSKSSKCGSESRETKKHSLNHQKHEHKHLDEIPVKQSVSQKRIEDHMKSTPCTTVPSSTSIPSTMQAIMVCDKGVQCGGILDYSDEKYGVLNPVRTLNFLMTELKHLVKDERANKILNDMEQILFRIPIEPGKPFPVDPEAKALCTKLEATTIQLEETSRKMNAMCESLREERDSLQRQVHKQVLLLNESRERQLDLESTMKTLKQELEEAIKIAQTRDKTISELKKEIKGYEFSQNVVADLRINLAEQTELARQRHLEVQYLTLEKDKFFALSSYKDSLLIELRNAIKELQNHIADQLSGLKNICIPAEDANLHISLVHGGLACSSPTSMSSQDSNAPTSWHDMSDVSLSTVDHNPPKNGNVQRFTQKTNKALTVSESQMKNSDKKRTKNVRESQTKDSVNLEFISLPGGESSHTLLPSYKDLGYTEISQSVNKGKEDVVTTIGNEKNDGLRNSKSIGKISSSEHSNLSPEKEIRVKDPPKSQQSLELNKKQSSGKKLHSAEDVANTLKNNLPHNLIGSSITEQFQNMFHDIRVQSRMPVNVPSPPRNYPHPDWSDSTLPSISTASELNVIQLNDT
ncbi:uncharacterized protein LOC117608663 [Osmia lignaria lignaria]|uniref:uncharacterized protein LOC117608663 n=1 Tax=Osmia lignaria lignaria TaxID=1437193 RepID=UPI00402BA3DA